MFVNALIGFTDLIADRFSVGVAIDALTPCLSTSSQLTRPFSQSFYIHRERERVCFAGNSKIHQRRSRPGSLASLCEFEIGVQDEILI